MGHNWVRGALIFACMIELSVQQGFGGFPSLFGGDVYGNNYNNPYQSGYPGQGSYPGSPGYGNNYQQPQYNNYQPGTANQYNPNTGYGQPAYGQNPTYNQYPQTGQYPQNAQYPANGQYTANPSYNGYPTKTHGRPSAPAAHNTNPHTAQGGQAPGAPNQQASRPVQPVNHQTPVAPTNQNAYRPGSTSAQQPYENGQGRPTNARPPQYGNGNNFNNNPNAQGPPQEGKYDNGQYDANKYGGAPANPSPLLDVRQGPTKSSTAPDAAAKKVQDTPAWSFFEPEKSKVKN